MFYDSEIGIAVLRWPAGRDKVLCQMYKGNSYFNKQTSFRLETLINNSDRIKIIIFAY